MGNTEAASTIFFIVEQKQSMEIELLETMKQIVQNTEPTSSTQIVISENSTKIVTTFNPPIELNKNKSDEMALVNLETYYSFQNIHDENNVFRYSPGFVEVRNNEGDSSQQRQWIEIHNLEGSYALIDIEETIKNEMKGKGHIDEN